LTVINDILDFSKIEAGRLEVETIPFSLRESLGDTMKTLALEAHRKGLELAYEIAPDTPDALLGDRSGCARSFSTWWAMPSSSPSAVKLVMRVQRQSSDESGGTCYFT